MKARHWLPFGLLILLANVVRAENGCPSGMIPASGTDVSSCVPIPPGYFGNQQQAPAQRSPNWSSRWGAVATDGVKGSLGVITDVSSRAEAERAAMADCQSKGGSQCKIDVSYSNGCAAMVVDDDGYNVESAATIDQAVQSGMNACSKAGRTNCHVYYSACSTPQLNQ